MEQDQLNLTVDKGEKEAYNKDTDTDATHDVDRFERLAYRKS